MLRLFFDYLGMVWLLGNFFCLLLFDLLLVFLVFYLLINRFFFFCGFVFIGRFIVKVVPLFGSVLNVIDPLWLFMIVFVIVSPRPVPLPSFLVVK